MSSRREMAVGGKRVSLCNGRDPRKPGLGECLPTSLTGDGLSRVETEKAPGGAGEGWGGVEAALSCISYSACSPC